MTIEQSASDERTEGDGSGWKARGRAFRGHVRTRPPLNLAYRVGIAVVGGLVLVLGIVAIPYPGPGWALVFAGFGILATEFLWARHALHWIRGRYQTVMNWYTSQGWPLKILGAVVTVAVVVATLWLLGTFSMAGSWIGVDEPWLKSPLLS